MGKTEGRVKGGDRRDTDEPTRRGSLSSLCLGRGSWMVPAGSYILGGHVVLTVDLTLSVSLETKPEWEAGSR